MNMRSLIAFCSVYLLFMAFLQGQSPTSWQLRKNKDGIRVYTRKVNQSEFREFRGVADVHGTPAAIIALLRDIATYPQWVPYVLKTSLLRKTGDKEMIYYMATDAPWPVQDRDGIYRFRFRQEGGNTVIAEVDCLPDFLPPKEGYVRIRQTKGEWRLESRSGDQVRITYQVLADPGGDVPGWLANAAVVNQPFLMLERLRDRLK